MYERRRMIISDSKELGRIIITAANTTNYVKVGDVTYTAPIILPIKKELIVQMKASYFTWQVENGQPLDLHPWGTDDGHAVFTSLMGHIYTIDAVNKTIHVTLPEDWNGFIFASDRPHYPYAPMYTYRGTPWRGQNNGEYFFFMPYGKPPGAASGTLAAGITFYPVDLTGFSSVHGAGSRAWNSEASRSNTFNFCICPSAHTPGTIDSECVLEAMYTDGGSNIGEISLTTDSFTLGINLTGEYSINWDNAYAETSACLKELWFNK